jgi:hypothetical protein
MAHTALLEGESSAWYNARVSFLRINVEQFDWTLMKYDLNITPHLSAS